MKNDGIGYVRYQKDFTSGTLSAIWSYYTDGQIFAGTGVGTGTQGNTFSGEYKITYYTDGSKDSSNFDLVISEKNDQFILEWFLHGILQCIGIGRVEDNIITAGWREW
jgi:hypothetical protein